MGCYRPHGPLGCKAVMGSSKAMPRMQQFNPASPAGAFLTCPWFSLWVCGHFFNCRAGGPGHVTRSAYPGSTSLNPGRNQAATGIKVGELLPLWGPARPISWGFIFHVKAHGLAKKETSTWWSRAKIPFSRGSSLPAAALARGGWVCSALLLEGEQCSWPSQEGPGCFRALFFHWFVSTKKRRAEGRTITTALYSVVPSAFPTVKVVKPFNYSAKLSATAKESSSLSTGGFWHMLPIMCLEESRCLFCISTSVAKATHTEP